MRLFWRKKKKERFNQKLIHVAKIHHLIYQSKIVITFGVIRSAVIGFAVINRRLSSPSVSSAPRSSASSSSIADCHHDVSCHPLRGHRLPRHPRSGHQSKIVITTCRVIATRCVIAKRHPLRGHPRSGNGE